MLSWIQANLSTILVLIVLAALLIGTVVFMIKRKKEGKNSCGCGCSGCEYRNKCHKQK
ncbi:MAG: FeoB-associated Cys-rich membrane protein [Lachnospiraceae bacterium]|nr:FeoB-associated Cys-rich membrane protein [Lachnospiraceae bacterium]